MEASSAAVERRRPRETAIQRLLRQTAEFFGSLGRMAVLAAILTPFLLAAFLTVDLPVYAFDGLVGGATALRPSNWLSSGVLIMALAPLAAILFTRKYGGDEASRAVTAAWGLVALAIFAELSYLAPRLETGDLPPARFAFAFVAGAMAAQYVAVNIYDIVRGGVRWWRAPLFAALGGAVANGMIYFPIVYFGAPAPWASWMIAYFALTAVIAAAFLPFYKMLRRALRPSGGYGG